MNQMGSNSRLGTPKSLWLKALGSQRSSPVTQEHFSEGIQQDSKDKRTVWIGLEASNYTWRWLGSSSFDAATFGSLRSVGNGCATFRDKKLEDDSCESEHNWVCQTKPFHLLAKAAGGGELCGALPEKPGLQDSCC